MKKYLVIGNPIEHSLSPILHSYWIKKNNLNAIYDKKKMESEDLENFISKIKKKEIDGANVTVPFKKEVIPYLDELTLEARNTQSVNTIYLDKDKIVGHNTDIRGFEMAIQDVNYDPKQKKVFIIGAGGVVPSIVYALYKMEVSKIYICNRTKKKAQDLKNLFQGLTVLDWGELPDFDMIINATSVGLNNSESINLDFSKINAGKFFYDVIYNPNETNFLKTGKQLGNKIENGKKMFIYQASESFKVWHGIKPEINIEIDNLLSQ